MSMTKTTFKIQGPSTFVQQGTFRRFRLDEPNLTRLRNHTATLFSLQEDQAWYFKYKDEDGDLIDLTEEEELAELLEHCRNTGGDSATVRLHIFLRSQTPTTRNGPSRTPQAPFVDLINTFASAMAEGSQAANHTGNNRRCSGKRPQKEWRARCDVTNTLLKPGDGWYHQLGTSLDLSEAEYDKLTIGDKGAFTQINSPRDLGEDAYRYLVCVPPQQHRRPQQQPAPQQQQRATPQQGPQQQQQQQQPQQQQQQQPEQQQQQAAPQRQPEQQQRQPQLQQPANVIKEFVQAVTSGNQRALMAWCDVTHLPLFPGRGWYHKKGHNFDLCQGVFAKLPKAQQARFVRVDNIASLGEDAARYGGPSVTSDSQQAQQNQPTKDAPPVCGERSESTGGDSEGASCSTVGGGKQARVVSGPSVGAGSSVDGGATVVPVWEVKNVAANATDLWTDVRVEAKESDSEDEPIVLVGGGVEAPMLASGESGLVALELKVKESAVGRRVRREFNLVDGDGNVFGEPLVLEVFVEAPPVEGEEAAVEKLVSMGFANNVDTVRLLRSHKGDVNLTALALLRFSPDNNTQQS